MTLVHQAKFNEDGSLPVYAAITAPDGTGLAHQAGNGYFVKAADLSAISRSVYDISNNGSTLVRDATALTPASVIEDTPVTDEALWDADEEGFNFSDIVPPTFYPTGGNKYRTEYKFTMSDGINVYWLLLEGVANKVHTS